jgi:protein gp37
MGETTISWTDYTFNAWMGCAKVSPGCQNCYAESMANHRTNWGVIWGIRGTRVRTAVGNWKNPVKWNKEAEKRGRRARVFCSSLADVFEDRADLLPFRKDLFDLIKATPWLDWLLLTKRPQNIQQMLPPDWNEGWDNVWLGTSTEDQIRYDQRVDILLGVKAKVRFLSAEPLLGEIKLRHSFKDGLHWIIVGGESGCNFREMKLDWARSLRDEAKSRKIVFFFKQHSAHRPKTAGELLDGKKHHHWPVSPASGPRNRSTL